MTDQSVIVNIFKNCRRTRVRVLAAPLARALRKPALKSWRAQGMPGAQRARSPACSVESTRGSHHGHAGTPGIPRAMVLRLISRSPWRSGFLVTIAGVMRKASSPTCRRRRGVRTTRLRRPLWQHSSFVPIASTASRPALRDDRETPLIREAGQTHHKRGLASGDKDARIFYVTPPPPSSRRSNGGKPRQGEER